MGQGFSKTASINGCYALNPEQRRDEDEEKEEFRKQKYHCQNTISKNNANSVHNTVNCTHNSEDVVYSSVFTATTEVNICNSANNSSSIKPNPQNVSSPNSPTLSEENQLSTTPSNPTSCPRQIIIKIQLAKMENDYQAEEQLRAPSEPDNKDISNNNRVNNLSPSNNNKYRANPAEGQYLNVTVNEESVPSSIEFSTTTKRSSDISPHLVINNNFVPKVLVTTTTSLPASPKSIPERQEEFNILMSPMGALNLNERCISMVGSRELSDVGVGESTKIQNTKNYSGELKTATSSIDITFENRGEDGSGNSDGDHCCRRKSKSNALPSKWRHCKCTCRDAFKRIIDGSSPSSYSPTSNTTTAKSTKKKERKDPTNGLPINSKSPQKGQPQHQQAQRHHSNQHSAPVWTPLQEDNNSQSLQTNNYEIQAGDGTTTSKNNAAAHMSIWSPNKNDVIIPLSSPQFVVVQCPPSSLVTLGRIDDNAIRLMATELVPGNSPQSSSTGGSTGSSSENAAAANIRVTATTQPDLSLLPLAAATLGNTSSSVLSNVATPSNLSSVSAVPATTTIGPVVHSQVDYIHCLVPDLEKIIKASFYWGKMDRYEAERLLEGKPEGTFLLRDSAQEEYLFSVTFRKYGRSLHARIEQSNHKFSFDCHDPCVFTASTVTGLLEHYKDPACVMFFEPMLTIPLHRNSTFKLQQLCRATIVSHTSYDGINELELPARLKAYLKEYHYKQKLRVKPFDEPFYTCT